MSGQPTKLQPRRAARKLRSIVGPIRRRVLGHSSCPSHRLSALDWLNWWLDGGFGDGCYLHVRAYSVDEGETWHRVYPHKVRGRECHRVAVYDGALFWLHDTPNNKSSVSEPAAGEE